MCRLIDDMQTEDSSSFDRLAVDKAHIEVHAVKLVNRQGRVVAAPASTNK